MGKTALALEYAKGSQKYPSGIFWLDGTNAQTLKASFQELATQLAVSPSFVDHELSQMTKFLLIFDNVTDHLLIPSLSWP